MDPTTMSSREIMIYASLINAGIGLVFGLVPLISGFVKRNVKYGVIGFLGSIVGGALLGLLLAIPVAAIFTWLIVKRPRQNTQTEPQSVGSDSQNS